jgi:hypothetical protein
MQTTLYKIESQKPCENGWKKLLHHLRKTESDDEPLELITILEYNCIQDTIWAFRAVEGKDKEIRLFAADCAEMVLHIYEKNYPNDKRPRLAIQAARDYANGLIPLEELAAAVAAAWDAASAAARAAGAASAASAASAAARAAGAASAARAAARAAAVAAAWDAASAAARAAGAAGAASAARAAARDAASAALAAARDAADAASAAAGAAAWDAMAARDAMAASDAAWAEIKQLLQKYI